MFTVAQRADLCSFLLGLGQDHPAVVAGAVVGSLAAHTADDFSDLDLTFAIADQVSVAAVLGEWTARLVSQRGAVPLVDLSRGATQYRVFLLPDALQLDLSMTPSAHFRPSGPRFRLAFGQAATADSAADRPVGSLFIDTPARAADMYGWGVVYALHARACIERGRLWQAEHYVAAVRDHALSMACLRLGLTVVQARGFDDLPEVVRRRLEPTLIAALQAEPLRRALAAATQALLLEGREAQLPHSAVVAERLVELL